MATRTQPLGGVLYYELLELVLFGDFNVCKVKGTAALRCGCVAEGYVLIPEHIESQNTVSDNGYYFSECNFTKSAKQTTISVSRQSRQRSVRLLIIVVFTPALDVLDSFR